MYAVSRDLQRDGCRITASMKNKNKIIGPRLPPHLQAYVDGTAQIPSHTRQILPLQRKLRPLLRRAWPEASDKDIGWLNADLAGLWEVSRWHVKLIRELLKTKPRDRVKLQRISQELDVNWSNARSHLETLERELSRFKRSLYSEKNPSRSRSVGSRNSSSSRSRR